MNHKPETENEWSKSDLELLRDLSLSYREVASRTGRSVWAVKSKRQRLRRSGKLGKRVSAAAPANLPPDHERDRVAAGNTFWEGEHRKLSVEYKKALKQNALVDRLVNSITEIAPTSYSPAPRIPSPVARDRRNQTPESAVLVFSDTHIGKVVRREQTLGFAEYNFPTFLARLKYLENAVLSILDGHTTAPIEELVIPMIGDMLDGSLAHGSEGGLRNVVFNQFYQGGHAIAQFLRVLASRVPKVRIYTAVGNHTRWGTQKKMPTENRFSNFDMFLYSYIEALTRDIPNIQWTLDEQPFAVFKIQGWNFFASHGDNMKGGDAAFGIPMHSMARQLNSTTQLFHKHGADVPHYYLMGHFHRPIQLPTGLGDFTINGAFPGLDGYALTGNFNPVDPAQVFFRVHPKYGKIAEYKIALKHAELGKPTYDMPAGFSCE